MAWGKTRSARRRRAELDAWLSRAVAGDDQTLNTLLYEAVAASPLNGLARGPVWSVPEPVN